MQETMQNKLIMLSQFQKDVDNWHFDTEIFNSEIGNLNFF